MRALAAVLVSILPAFAGQAQDPPPRLNVLLIVADDLNAELGCYGQAAVKSPHVDRLAARGVRFDRAYCQYPLCNPSRTSFLSGRRPDTTRIFENETLPWTHLGDAVFLPEHFRKHGYFTARVGKIAHGAAFEKKDAWDVSENSPKPPRMPAEERIDRYFCKDWWLGTPGPDEKEPDGSTARRVAGLIEEKKGRPFFIAAGLHKPHRPFIVPKNYFDLYDPGAVSFPSEPADDRADIPPLALADLNPAPTLTPEQRRMGIAAYYAAISFMDAQVGVLLDTLDRLKLWENTVVVFFGDHGYHTGEHGGIWQKMTLFERGTRTPLIVAAPGRKAGAVSPRFVELVDVYPTLSELCGLTLPEGLEGTSFAPLLSAPDRPWKKAAFSVVRHQGTLGRSVRIECWRYTEWGDEKAAELYDLENDPHEFANLASDPAHEKVRRESSQLLKEGWRAALPP